MKKITFSHHALEKIEILKKHNVEFTIIDAEKTIISPDSVESGYKNRKIAQRFIDENHILRIVFEESEDEIIIVTMYPARRKRYEKD